jgi:thiamine monophosphate synthase
MKQFYDQTYRNALGKMVKPYGVKVGQADLPSQLGRALITMMLNLGTSFWI